MTDLFATVRNRDNESISDMLRTFGVSRVPAAGRRYLYVGGECIGLADAQEAINLLGLLVQVKATMLAEVRAADLAEASGCERSDQQSAGAEPGMTQTPSPSLTQGER